MASKAPSKSGKPPPGKPTGKKAKSLSQKEQSARFIETAKELGADKTGEAFEKVLEVITPPKKPASQKPA